MAFLVTKGRNVVSSILTCAYSENRRLFQSNIKNRLRLKTVVAGHDNKHSFYKTQIPIKWRYGDDSCFITKTVDADVIGISDGVGGWRAYGIDPSKFSFTLMNVCHHIVDKNFKLSNEFNDIVFPPILDSNVPDPLWLLNQAYNHVTKMKKVVYGSATSCIISFERSSGRLTSASIGDSAYIIVRNGKVIFKSSTQKHAFNTPYQLALLPQNSHPTNTAGYVRLNFNADINESQRNNENAFTGNRNFSGIDEHHFHSDRPETAQCNEFQVEIGDVVVAASDGLFDNVSDSLIASEIQQAQMEEMAAEQQSCANASYSLENGCNNAYVKGSTFGSFNHHSTYDSYKSHSIIDNDCSWLKKCAKRLVECARVYAHESKYLSPFAQEARLYGLEFTGGNPGDITVILGLVIEESELENVK